VFSSDETRIVRKIYLADQGGRTPENVWDGSDVGVTRDANREIREIFGSAVFDTPKPTGLIRRILQLATTSDSDDIVLDFFAGSASTAHAVALQNEEDGGRRGVISVNLAEATAAESQAERDGYKTVSAITLARIQWVMANVSSAAKQGLRSFQLSVSNFRELSADAHELFDLGESTLVDDQPVVEDIAAEVLLKEGVALHAAWERHTAGGSDVIVADGVAVVASLEITDVVVASALALEPRVVVFLEDGFAGKDAVKANAFTNARNRGITMKTA
jgi:adenine-specific DNA-methyltransferase